MKEDLCRAARIEILWISRARLESPGTWKRNNLKKNIDYILMNLTVNDVFLLKVIIQYVSQKKFSTLLIQHGKEIPSNEEECVVSFLKHRKQRQNSKLS